MKRITILALILTLAFTAKSQSKKAIDGFLGIKFGSTTEEVTKAMEAKGFTHSERLSKPGSDVYLDVTVNGHPAYICMVFSTDNKAYSTVFVFKPKEQLELMDLYNEINKDLSGAYGPGVVMNTFSKGTTEAMASFLNSTYVTLGDAKFETMWTDATGFIIQKTRKEGDVMLTYSNTKMSKEAEAKKSKDDSF